jgi:trimethylamine--corrinoid protein Co-methyltransferase
MAEAGVPAAIVPCSLMGLTAPCTVAGLLTVDIAEILACNVLLQTANPGHPVYINWMSGAVDMMTGAKTQSSPADVLRNLAMVDMGHYMGMAVLGFMASSANATDAQCGWETMANLQSQYIYGMDLMAHVACLSAEDIYDPRSAVIGDEMINWVKLFKKGFDVSDEAMAIDEVIKYGPAGINGDFLKSKHTRKYYQKTLMKSTPLANHLNRDGWVSAGQTDLRDRAAELVKEKVTQNKPKIPESLEKEIRAYISEILDRENIKGDEAKEIIDKTYWQGF